MDSAYMQDMAYIDSKLKALESKTETIFRVLKQINDKVNKLAEIQKQSLASINKYSKRVNTILEEVKHECW